MDEADLPLYDSVVGIAAARITAAMPLLDAEVAWNIGVDIIKELIEEDLLAKPERCGYANGPRTVICENDAPIGKTWCYVHGN